MIASAAVWINEAHQVGVERFHGDEGVLDRVDKVRELAADFDLRELVFDPRRFGQAAQELERERLLVTQVPQTDVRMIPASERLYRAVVAIIALCMALEAHENQPEPVQVRML